MPSLPLAGLLESRWHTGGSGPLVVGIGGGSGSGKSTIAAQIAAGLGPLGIETIDLDRFFRAPEEMPTYYSTLHGGHRPNFNHPDSFRREQMIARCRDVQAFDVVIIEGILALYFAELRSMMHLRCYVTIPVPQMLARRKQRNLAVSYGGTEDEITWYNRECVSPNHQRFNAPTVAHADVLIPNDDGAEEARDRMVADLCHTVRRVRAR